jgi:hypothetical protein
MWCTRAAVALTCISGIDVHKKSVVVCLLTPGTGSRPAKEVRTFGTMTADLLALLDWLLERGCTHVAMESTGVFTPPTIVLTRASRSA